MKGGITYLRVFIVGVILFYSSISQTVGQSNCSQTLSDAIRKFEAGQLNEIEDLLSSCLRSGFTKEERIQAFRLLTLVHLYQDDRVNAEESFLKMLVLNKEFIVDTKSDPSELVYLAGMYRIRPIFTAQVRVGANYTMPHVINRYSFTSDSKSIEQYTSGINFKFSGALEYTFLKYIQAGIEGSAAYAGFNYLNDLDDRTTIEFKESQLWLDVPAYIKFGMPIKSYTPYLYAGASYSFLLSDQASELSNKYNGEEDKTYEGPNIDFMELRKGYNISVLGGLGLKKKVGTDYWVVDIRYTKGLTNLVDKSTRYNSDVEASKIMANDYSYIDPDFSINQYAITFGYIKSIYKPKKLKKN